MRIESTHVDTTSFDSNTKLENYKAGGNCTDALPSASLRFLFSDNENVRVAKCLDSQRPTTYLVQREFYKPTFAVGFRLTP